jgi:RNA-binding protein YhbY
MEKAWRSARKPLLSIGSKGATLTHGNSLRQLLQDHTIVKVKINTRRFDNSLEQAYEAIKELAVESGLDDMELLHVRESEKTILVGLPGTRKLIEAGEYPMAEREL